ncbi:MAG: hypothetical protein NUV77_22775 [Thermoguttaceae bacterium]|jgi:hypothetical protein|nr:hypothetical protein [Thermoguttaceae bacterium]
MEINRNQVFIAGVVLVLLGIEFRMIDSFVLNPRVTKLLAEQTKHPVATASSTMESLVGAEPRLPPKTVKPQEWIGWLLVSVGSVLILHSMTMPKPS